MCNRPGVEHEGQKKQKARCVRVLSAWQSCSRRVCGWTCTRLLKSGNTSKSLHCHITLTGDWKNMRGCVCVWEEGEWGGIFELLSDLCDFLPLFSPSRFFDEVTADLWSKKQVGKRRREVSCYCRAATQLTVCLLNFSFHPKEPFSMTEAELRQSVSR